MLKTGFRYSGDLVIIDFDGDITVDASNFVEAIGWALARGYKKILCNFEGINIVDYVGISLIAVSYKNVVNHKSEMRICGAPAHVVKLFTAVGLDQVFDYYLSEDQAIKSFYDDKRIARVLAKKFRRRFKRVRVRGEVEYQSKGALSDTFYKGSLLNISAVGVFVECNHIFPIGEILNTRLKLDELSMELDTRVIWIADHSIQVFDAMAMGLEFYHISPDNQTIAADFVERHLSRLR